MGHSVWKTRRQQDAEEWARDLVARRHGVETGDPHLLDAFGVEYEGLVRQWYQDNPLPPMEPDAVDWS